MTQLSWNNVKKGDTITIFNNYRGTPEYGEHVIKVDHPDDIRPNDPKLILLHIETKEQQYIAVLEDRIRELERKQTNQTYRDYRCPDCGYYPDTPNHEFGCQQ